MDSAAAAAAWMTHCENTKNLQVVEKENLQQIRKFFSNAFLECTAAFMQLQLHLFSLAISKQDQILCIHSISFSFLDKIRGAMTDGTRDEPPKNHRSIAVDDIIIPFMNAIERMLVCSSMMSGSMLEWVTSAPPAKASNVTQEDGNLRAAWTH